MEIGLVGIVVPTILILVVLILYINSRSKRVMKEVVEIKTQLERLDNVTESHAKSESENEITDTVATVDITVAETENKDAEQDAETAEAMSVEASAYNTGKSGKIYTKEELELLIKE